MLAIEFAQVTSALFPPSCFPSFIVPLPSVLPILFPSPPFPSPFPYFPFPGFSSLLFLLTFIPHLGGCGSSRQQTKGRRQKKEGRREKIRQKGRRSDICSEEEKI
jgi:hypothetical protein